jgi:hypothetical protein
MKWKFMSFCAVVCALTVTACSKDSKTPAAPGGTDTVNANASADGSTLKVTAPTPQSPTNGQKVEMAQSITLTVTNAAAKFGANLQASYRFQVFNAAGGLLVDATAPSGGSTTSYVITKELEGDKTYTWQARAEMQGQAGPWSSRATFIAPQTEGYKLGSELYDPLINGKTIGSPSGAVHFVPGVGLKFDSQNGFVAYVLPQTLTEGEFSLLVTGMPTNTDGGKTKLFSMAEGFDDIVTNNRRMTVEKRGDPAGVVAWRFITHDDQVDTEGAAERRTVNFDANQTYFWQATWRANRFNLRIREGGVDGREIYNFGKPFQGAAYDPAPHVIYLGAPIGRSGLDGASVDQAIIRQVWVSARPRPAFANK